MSAKRPALSSDEVAEGREAIPSLSMFKTSNKSMKGPPKFFSNSKKNILENPNPAAAPQHEPREALPSLSMFKIKKSGPPSRESAQEKLDNAARSRNYHEPREELPSLSQFKLSGKERETVEASRTAAPSIPAPVVPRIVVPTMAPPPSPGAAVRGAKFTDSVDFDDEIPTRMANEGEFSKEIMKSLKEDEMEAVFRKDQVHDMHMMNKEKKNRKKLMGLLVILLLVGLVAAVLFMGTSVLDPEASQIEQTCSVDEQEFAKAAIKEGFALAFTTTEDGIVYQGPQMTCLPTDAFRDLTPEEIVQLQEASVISFSNCGLNVFSPLWAGVHNFTNTKEMDFSFNSIRNIPEEFLQKTPNVEVLSFESNIVERTTAGIFSNGDNLQHISFRNNGFLREIPAGVKDCPNVQTLDFAECIDMRGAAAGQFNGMENLQLVDFTRSRIVRVFSEIDFRSLSEVKSDTVLLGFPTNSPTNSPTDGPTTSPTDSPTNRPTRSPTNKPTTLSPSQSPTTSPTKNPTGSPTTSPSKNPTTSPTPRPTRNPTKKPTPAPTRKPTPNPTPRPTVPPTDPPYYYIVSN